MTAEVYTDKHLLRNNDILFARTGGTVGKTFFYDGSIGDAIFAGYCIRFSFDKSKVLPKYVYWNTKTTLYENWVKGIQRPSGQPNINKEEFKSFKILLPCFSKQEQIINFMDEAFLSYQQKLKEAEKVRENIVFSFQKGLNISLFETKKELCSVITFEDIKRNATKRLDPKCYSAKFQNIRNAIDSSSYPKYRLRDLILGITGGDWGYEPNIEQESYQKCLVLRATEISNKDNIEIKEDKAQYRQIEKKKLAAMDVEIGDIIIEKSGGSIDQPVGRAIYVDQLSYNGCPIAYSNFLTKLKINKNLVDPYYLFEYLRFIYKIGLTEVMQNQTNGIRNLIIDEFLDQTIIVPPNHYEIGQQIKSQRLYACEIEKQAEIEWQEAKRQFEKELLGE